MLFGKPKDEDIVRTPESICDSPSAYEVAVSCFKREATVVQTAKQSAADRSRTAVFLSCLFVVVPAVLVLLAAHTAARGSHPTDEELTARFLSHESEFQSLVQMLDSDRGRLPLGAGPFELADMVAAGAGTANIGNYANLLAKIDVKNFRYFPRSGTTVLPVSDAAEDFAGAKKAYLYLSREEPQPLLHHPSYAWRGPGIYFVTGDHRIKGKWFIHHDGTVAVAFAPY